MQASLQQLNRFSYLDIARELGTTHSNVHYYFRTKSKLAETVLRAGFGIHHNGNARHLDRPGD